MSSTCLFLGGPLLFLLIGSAGLVAFSPGCRRCCVLISLLVLFVLDGVGVLVGVFQLLVLAHGPLQGVKNAAHEDRTEEVLEWYEWVVDAEEERGETEVDEEDDDTEVDDGVRGLQQVESLADEDDGCGCRSLGDAKDNNKRNHVSCGNNRRYILGRNNAGTL